MKKRLPRCWPASPGRRKVFMKPRDYSHRGERTGGQVMARVMMTLRHLTGRIAARADSIWVVGDELDRLTLPRRAEDLLHVLAHEDGLAVRRRGVTLAALAEMYDATEDELLRVVVTIREAMTHARHLRGNEHDVQLLDAYEALKRAHHRLEPEPIVT